MAEYTRLTVTANLGFVSTEPSQLAKTAKAFKSDLAHLLTAEMFILPEELSVTLTKMKGTGFAFRNTNTNSPASYHLSIMGHIRNFESEELINYVYTALDNLVKVYQAEMVIFSLLADEKYSENKVLKTGQYIHF